MQEQVPIGFAQTTEYGDNTQFNPNMYVVSTFKVKLKKAGEEGLLLFAKYALALVLAFFTLQFVTSIISGSNNGTNAVLYLKELQDKGYLPKVINGAIPPKTEGQVGNATPLK